MKTLIESLLDRVSRAPESASVYLQHSGRSDARITYADLLRGSNRYAQAFRARGLLPGEVVILILQHGDDLIFSFWGAILYGAIPSIMPFLTEKLPPEQYRADLAALISVTRPAGIVTYPEFEGEVRSALTEGGSVRAVISTATVAALADDAAVPSAAGTRSPTDIVLLQHSSGTTGLQKGVALSHRAVLNQLQAYGKALDLGANDVVVSWLPLYHDMGLIAGFLMPILSGVPLVLSSPFDWVRAPYRLLQSVSHYKGTLSWLPNFSFNFCTQKVRDRSLEGVDLSSWRAVINCSEPVRWESHHAFFGRFKPYGLREDALQTSYAMAENVFGVTQSDLTRPPSFEALDKGAFVSRREVRRATDVASTFRMMSSGTPLANTEVRVLDDSGATLPERRIGEIALRSDCMLTGYYNRPDADQKAFRAGWFLTGDYGYLSAGELYVWGRKKDVIIVGGKNVYPQDLEALSYEVPGVHPGRAVAFGVFDEQAGTEDVVMVMEIDSGSLVERERVADLVREHVTKNSAIALRHIQVVGPKWILKTSSGKTARAANRDKYLKEFGWHDA
jgi:fatty-acyl-CoA synthase